MKENFLFRIIESMYENVAVLYCLRKKIEKKGKIKVAFLATEPESWDIVAPVYEEFCKRKDVVVDLIVVPSFDSNLDLPMEYGYERNFFIKKYGKIIEAIDGNKNVIDLREYKYDYIFYQDPYDMHLPTELRSYCVVRYSKVCYIPYGFYCADVFWKTVFNKNFFRNVYFGFMDSQTNANELKSKFWISRILGCHHFEYLGYPALEPYLNMSLSHENYRICWTPRWTYDEEMGGSHFFEYKDLITSLGELFPQVQLTIRPHPLLFANMVKLGLMTEKDVENYKEELIKKDIILNQHDMIIDIFPEIDILITDISSVMIPFFLTGRPVIYCSNNIKLNKVCSKMTEGMYIADSWEDILHYLRGILSGNDYLKQKRAEIIESEFKGCGNAAKAIVDRVLGV